MRFRINITIDWAEKVMQKWQGRVASCQLQLQVARCKLVIYLVLQATVKKRKKNKHSRIYAKLAPGAKQTNCREASEGSSPKQMWGVLGIRRGRRRTSTGCSLLWCSFHFFSLFEYLWNATRVAWLRARPASCTLHLAVGRLQTLWIPLWVIKCVAAATLWAPRATTVQQAELLNVLPLLAGIQHQQDNL